MNEKKLQIFVSSTYTDLKEERQAAVEAILSSGHIPAGMELFAAGDESQMTVIERWIDESDVYLLILGGRYGSIDKTTGKSYTQLEYEYALSKKKPLFAVVISDKGKDEKVKSLGRVAIEQDNSKLLKDFESIVVNNMVKYWDDKKDIKIAIHETISDLNYRKELVGWIRAGNEVNTGFLAEEIARLTKENSELRKQLEKSSSGNALYANLTYEEWQQLLTTEIITVQGEDMNLLYFLLLHAPDIANRDFVAGEIKSGMERLSLLKLVQLSDEELDAASFTFTDDGHSFYLKARLRNL